MFKRTLFIIDHKDRVYQRGFPLPMPEEMTRDANFPNEPLFVAAIDLLTSGEQQNLYQVIAVPGPESEALHKADFAMVVDIPERNVGIVYNQGSLEDCRLWIQLQRKAEQQQDAEDRQEMIEQIQAFDENQQDEQTATEETNEHPSAPQAPFAPNPQPPEQNLQVMAPIPPPKDMEV